MRRQPPDITQLHQAQLVDIGQILREKRELQALSHQDLFEKTLIRPLLLAAIEQAAIDELPEPVYTRGLIRQYANALGLDGDTLSSQYFTPPRKPQERSFWRIPLTPQLRPIHLYMAYVMLIAIAVSGLSYTLKRTGYPTSTIQPLDDENRQELIAQPQTTNSSTASLTNPSTSSLGEADNAPIRVEVAMRDQSWLRITTDGKVTFEGILKEGDSQAWTAAEKLTIRAGNAGGVLVSYNEETAKTLGKPGTVAEVTYSLETEETEISLGLSEEEL